jgi:hypothetical protein
MSDLENTGGLSWRARAFIFGGLMGALAGLGAAYIYINSVKEDAARPEIKPSSLVALGLTVLGLLRQVAALSEAEDDKRVTAKKK